MYAVVGCRLWYLSSWMHGRGSGLGTCRDHSASCIRAKRSLRSLFVSCSKFCFSKKERKKERKKKEERRKKKEENSLTCIKFCSRYCCFSAIPASDPWRRLG